MNRATHRGVYVLNDLISQKDFYSLQETSHLLNLSMNELLSEISNRSLDLYINTKFLGVSRWDSLRENTVGLEIFFNKKLDNVKTFFFKGRISEVFFFEENNNIKQDEFFLSADKVVYGGYFVINKSRSFLIEKDMFFTKEMTLEQIRTPTINSELKEDVIANVCLKLKYINPFEYDECFISSYSIRCFFFKKLQRKGFCARYIYLQKFFKNALKAFNTSDLDTDNTVATSNLIGELRSDQQKTIQQLQARIIELEDLVNTNVEQYRDVNSETVLELQNQISEKDKIIGELREQLQDNAQRQSAVDSEPVLENTKAYDVRERETHLLIIGALSDLLAANKQKYQKGNGGINQSAISKDIETEIIELLQPATKTRTIDTIRARIRESLNLITKAE